MSRASWVRLLDRDPFGRVRSDVELARLVLHSARNSHTPYATLVASLVGRAGVSEVTARDFWVRAVDHRRTLAMALGRPVHLRVAALDLVLAEHALPPPVVLDRRIVRSLVAEATHDALTDLPNRRTLMTVLEHELRQRRSPAVAVLDVDGFKQVNDRHGHARGDQVLRGLAEVMRASRRKGDVAARLGGDEFALVLTDADEKAAHAVLARVKASFERAFGSLGVTLSHGIVVGNGRLSAARLLEEADRRMYVAKRTAAGSGEGDPRAVALHATVDAGRFRSVHDAFAGHGVLVLPARTLEAVQRLQPILAPRILLADMLLPPTGGGRLLKATGALPGLAGRCLVAPRRRGGSPRKSPDGFPIVGLPPSAAEVARLLKGLGSIPWTPIPPFDSVREAAQTLRAVERLARGHLGGPAIRGNWKRPEIDHLRRLLGA
jgi:diguanylate cyclase (GGDEF)-like protein